MSICTDEGRHLTGGCGMPYNEVTYKESIGCCLYCGAFEYCEAVCLSAKRKNFCSPTGYLGEYTRETVEECESYKKEDTGHYQCRLCSELIKDEPDLLDAHLVEKHKIDIESLCSGDKYDSEAVYEKYYNKDV